MNDGKVARRALEPMARQLGLDYNVTHYAAPRSEVEVVMGALRCGEMLLHNFTDAEQWPVDDHGRGITKRTARSAAGHLAKALRRREGQDAISLMAQGFGRANASFWRDTANTVEDREHEDRLSRSARQSDHLAKLVARAWPVDGYDEVLERVAHVEARRDLDPDNPDALIDLHDYARRARATADALAVALCRDFDEFERAIVGPVYTLHLRHNLILTSDWTQIGYFWANLLSPAPVSHSDVIHSMPA